MKRMIVYMDNHQVVSEKTTVGLSQKDIHWYCGIYNARFIDSGLLPNDPDVTFYRFTREPKSILVSRHKKRE
jgi:hypothetical protein